MSPCPPVPRGHVPPVVPPGDTSAPAAKPPVVRRKPKWLEPTTPSPDKEFLGWYEEERRRFHPNAADGLPSKLLPRWAEWFPRALAHPLINGDVEKLRETCRRWFADPWGSKLRTPCPASAFIADGVWPQHIPGQHEGSAPAQETPAEARRRASADVGRGEAPPALDMQDTPAGIAWGRVLGAMREAGGAPAYAAGQLQGRFRAVELAGGCLVLEAPDKFALTLLDEDFGGAALNAAVRTLGLELRATVAGQAAAHAGGLQ
ncbi:hypothetical protein [Myxococcus sp. NMCA1]|uniref:hypothetical protein n=1 Tax=Myxococcus sp. NMCA1 TaxID=2996785 RepID=UPI002285DE99|nr:hypothetical protein [Myxococcus sp. NMCA1]WAM23854.1 hypothetical protein OZ403_25265 [Myxococcus sp. NMCA1]